MQLCQVAFGRREREKQELTDSRVWKRLNIFIMLTDCHLFAKTSWNLTTLCAKTSFAIFHIIMYLSYCQHRPTRAVHGTNIWRIYSQETCKTQPNRNQITVCLNISIKEISEEDGGVTFLWLRCINERLRTLCLPSASEFSLHWPGFCSLFLLFFFLSLRLWF